MQTLPWNRRAWHCGKGHKGTANDTHIAFEICEDGLTDESYFSAVYQEAVELTAYLCRAYGLDPAGRRRGDLPQRGIPAGDCPATTQT